MGGVGWRRRGGGGGGRGMGGVRGVNYFLFSFRVNPFKNGTEYCKTNIK